MRRAILPLLLVLYVGASVGSRAQEPEALKPADYGQFESVVTAAARGGLSPDGRWLAYGANRVSGQNELRIARVGTIEPAAAIPFGSQAVFTSTSDWVAYAIGYSEEDEEKMRAARQPIHRKMGLFNLNTRAAAVVDGVESFAFDRTGRSLAMKRYAPAASGGGSTTPPPPAGGRGAAASDTPPANPVGTTLIVRDLATGVDMTFGNVVEYVWQSIPTGRLLAMTIGADGQAGNGVHVYNAASSVVRVLDSSAASYSAPTWREDSADLVVLRSKTDDKRDGPTQVALAWTSLGDPGERAYTLDPAGAGILGPDERFVTFRRPSWLHSGSSDGPMVMLGVAEWTMKPPSAGRGAGAGSDASAAASPTATDSQTAGSTSNQKTEITKLPERPDVDVWHWKDARVMARQKISLSTDRQRIAETDHIETGQQRMVVPVYEDQQAYVRNSAVFGVPSMTTPLLLMTGDNDGTVHWHQSVELYNIARRAKKTVVMLVYNNEDHGLRVKKNQIDYHRRIRAWFDHYLKGSPAEPWITDGVTALERDAAGRTPAP